MRNIWLIFRRDASNLFRNVMSVIITVGLVMLPSFFAWYNILACWNVFDNTGNLSIAVASDDEGYTSDLMPIKVNVGDKVESALRANDRINWVITTSEDAVEGTKSGKYYAALVIPEDFSQQLLTFYEGDSASAEILYYVNEKVNAISPNITGAGADTVAYEVNSAFADTLSEVAAGFAKSLVEHTDEEGTEGQIALLANRLFAMADRIDQAADVLGLYSSLAEDTQGLLTGSIGLVDSARSQAENAASGSNSDKEALRNLAQQLQSSVEGLAASLEGSASLLADLESRAQALAADASLDVTAIETGLYDSAALVDSHVAEMNNRLAELEKLRDELHEGISAEIEALYDSGATEEEISAQVQVIVERTVLLDQAIASLSRSIEILQQASTDLTGAADTLEAGRAEVQENLDTLLASVAQAKADFDALKADFDSTLRPSIEKLKADMETLASDLDAAASKLGAAGSQLTDAANAAGGALGEVSGKITGARDKLRSAGMQMRDLGNAINEALAAGDTDTLRALLAGNVDDLAKALSAPVQIEREALFPVANFGSAMAPLYCALAIFIGSLLIMVATKPAVSERGRRELDNPKPRHLYFGRFGVVALISLMQTTVLGLGNMFLLKVQVTEPLLYMICFWVSGLVFAFMIYTMVVAFGNLGKALAVLLLIVQVTGCGGSYPLPIMPDFVQAISPYLPAAHVVDALRAAMFGVYQNDFWISIGTLLLFVLPFLLLGLVLRKPLEGFMNFYVSKVEESKIVE